jgi:hypothetical protein
MTQDDARAGGFVIGCGEIKCPATGKQYNEDPKHCATGGFPHYYFDQIQGIMALNNWPWCDVVVHTPPRTTVKRFPADPLYWTYTLLPALKMFYFDMFVPRMHARLAGRLQCGEIDEVMPVPRPVPIFDEIKDEEKQQQLKVLQVVADLLSTPLVPMLPIIDDAE